MRRVWPWVVGVIVSMFIVTLLVVGRAERKSYWIARGAIVHHAQVTPTPINRLIQRSPGQLILRSTEK